MARLLERLTPYNLNWIAWTRLWDKSATRIEQLFSDQQAQITDLFAALSSMPDIPDIHIAADYTGAANPDLLPVTVQALRYSNTTDNTTDATWSFSVDSGDLTATITDGLLEITAITATSNVTVTSVYNSVSKSRSFTAYLDTAPPPSTGSTGGGGGGSSAYDTSFTSVSSTTHAPVSDELVVTVSASGNVDLHAPLTVSTAAVGIGTFKVWGVWQWFDSGSSTWTDVGTEVSSNPDCTLSSSHGSTVVSNGTLSVSQTKTGLTPGNSEKFRLMARDDTFTKTMTLSGTASAVS